MDAVAAVAAIRYTGVVKWFNSSKGYGFIGIDDKSATDGQDVFVHYSGIQASGYKKLTENQRVEFSIAQVERGLQAEDVVILEG